MRLVDGIADTRIIPCTTCNGDGGWPVEAAWDGGREWWMDCPHCDGSGEQEIELAPVTLEDIEDLEAEGL
jgi:DnaJ-class molecular chaperone